MLLTLSIRNVVLMDRLDIDFREGLTVFTGETGAGKSMLLDALGLILGERFDQALLRSPTDTLSVSARFQGNLHIHALLKDAMVEVEEEDILIRRSFDPQGKGKAFVNDQPVTVTLLKHLGRHTLDIHGQFDRFLSSPQYGVLLDGYGKHEDLVAQTEAAYHTWQKSITALEQLKDTYAVLEKRCQEIIFDQGELASLQPKPQEETLLLRERATLKNATHNAEVLQQALGCFEGGLMTQILALQKAFSKCEGHKDLQDRLDHLVTELADIEMDVRHKTSLVEIDPKHLDTLDERLHALRQLARKHKVPVDELYGIQGRLEEERYDLEQIENTLIALEKDVGNAEKAFREVALQLRKQRTHAAKALTHQIMEELPPLKLENAQFSVEVYPLDLTQASASGLDNIEFMFSANPGMPLQPMAKVASGGELSRLMLALKVVLSDASHTQTLLFDEIDSGVGGATATAMGARLKRLSQHQQVIAITHSPQVAAFADQHYKVMKSVVGGKTFVGIETLEGPIRHTELARMLAGDVITEEAMKAAQSLVTQASL